MSKPHEETWEIDERPPARTGDVRITTNGDARRFIKERERLAVAAPQLARALVRLLSHHTTIMTKGEALAVTEAQAALTKAGVL